MGIQDGRDYLVLANDDLRAAVALMKEPHQYHNVCFHAQESAEKALKAVLLTDGLRFPKKHDVELLVDLIRQSRPDFPAFAEGAVVLSQYSVEARYRRAFRDEVDEEEAQQAIGFAQDILVMCQELVQ